MAESIRPYIVINGKSSREVSGLLIVSLPPISKPQMRVTAEEIDGRDGDIVTELGFSAYDKPVEIGLAGDYDINEVISYFNQAGVITFSNEPDKYYKFAQYNGIDFEKLIRFKTATVIFHVQPFKYDTESNDAVFWNPENITITNEGNIYSKPELAIQGSGNVGITLNGSEVLSLELGETKQAIIIDTDKMNAYGTKSNVKELIIDINPVQDLHGYDSVWVGGAGKNKLKKSYTSQTINGVTFTVNSDGSVNVNGTATSTALFPLGTLSNFLTNDTSYIVNGNTNTNAYLQLQTSQFGGVVNVGSGYQFTYTTGGEIQNLVIRVDTGKTASNVTLFPMVRLASETDASFEPYENICDISGWNGCVVSRTGVNIWDEEWELGALQWANGQPTPASDRIRSKNYNQIKPDTQYYMRADNAVTSGVPVVFYYDKDMNLISYSESTIRNTIIESPANAVYFKLVILQTTTYESGISLNYPSTDTTYHKFVGSKYQKFFEGLMAGTYGVVELGSLTWQKNGVNRFTATQPTDDIKAPAQTAIANIICQKYQASSFGEAYAETTDDIIAISINKHINIVDKEYSDATDFKNSLAGVYLIYELETATAPTITQPDINGLISAFGADLNAIVFGQTVFGGSLNVTTGLLTVTYLLKKISELTWFYNSTYDFFAATLSDLIGGYSELDIKSSVFENIYGRNNADMADAPNGTINHFGVTVKVKDTDYTDATAFKTALANETIWYKLATPIEIQLTAEEIQTIIGNNNIWSNTGDISECIYTRAGADVTTSGAIVSFEADASDLRDDILKNRLVTGNYDNLRLKAGSNQIGITGDVDVLVLSNFSRWL